MVQFARVPADTGHSMRQISPATNLLLACLAGLGLLATLSAPWYAPPVPDKDIYDGPVERAAFAFSKVFGHNPHAVSGSDALRGPETLLVVLVAAVVILCGLAAVPSLRRYVRDVLRGVAIAIPVVVFYLIFDRPDGMDIHWGVIAAFAMAVFTATAAWHGSAIRVRRAAPGSWQRKPA